MMRTEWGAGLITSMIANVNRDPKTPPFSPADFTLHFNKITVADEPISLAEAMSSWG